MFSTPSDPFLLIAFVTGWVAVALTAVLLVLILALRQRLRRVERASVAFTALWRPVLMEALLGPGPVALPTLHRSQRVLFLRLWNYLQESLHGESSERLNQVARQLKCDVFARALLLKGGRAEQLLAARTLGHLREAQAWAPLSHMAQRRDPVDSLNAARALVQIDPLQAASLLMPAILARRDWEIPHVARMLDHAQAAFGSLLCDQLGGLHGWPLLRGLQLARALRVALPSRVLLPLLAPKRSSTVIAAALHLVNDVQMLVIARMHLTHSEWRVRVQAIHVLARLGDADDVPRLVRLLDDPAWWVRYQAAQALTGTRLVTPPEREALLAQAVEDAASAAEMLHLVQAEKALA